MKRKDPAASAPRRRAPILICLILVLAVAGAVFWYRGTPPMLCRRGAKALEQGNAPAAAALYTRALSARPDDPAALVGRGDAYYAQLKLDLAAADLARAIGLGSDDPDAFLRLAMIYACWGDLARGEEVLAEGQNKVAPESAALLNYRLKPYSLVASGPGVTDLSELPRWSMVRDLCLADVAVDDYSPLTDLPELASLELLESGLTDISFLAPLTGLKTLYLNDNRVTDVTPLAGLSELETLVLANNRVTDVAPLAGLSRLETLVLVNNPDLTDVSALDGLPNLTTLRLEGTKCG